ncbi:unnamed protein product [Closterium sp. NIES-53]
MESTYLGHMDANIADVRKKLLLMTMEPNQKIIDYVNMARSYNDDLTAMGEPETERAMIGHIVNGLPEDWSGERPALICHPPENMTKLIAMLQALERARDHQKRREKFTKDVEQEKPALLNATAAGRSVGACYQCGKLGHKAFECAENPRSRNYKGNGAGWSGAQQNGAGNGRGSKGKFNGACHHCKKIGHRAIDCYSNPNSRSYRGPQQQGSAPPKANAAAAPTAAENDKEDAILGGAHKANVARTSGVCMLAKGGGASAWFMDSGTGCKTFSDKGKMWVFDHAWNVIAEGMRNDGLYEMKLNEKALAAEKATYQPPPKEGVMAREELKAKLKGVTVEELQVGAVAMVAAAAKVDLEPMHRRLGHAGMERIKELVKKGMAAGVELKEGDRTKGRCSKCVEGKISKTPHPIHQDKTRVFSSFLDWMAEAERQSGKQLKVLRTDNGGEFVNAEFNSFLRTKGILRQLTVPYTPQHNSIAERVNRSLLDSVRTMLADSGLPLKYWGDALGMACWVKNRLPTKGRAADMTPHEAFYGRKPNMGFARVWGCMAQYREPVGPDHKLLPRSKWGINLGMGKVSKGWVIKDVETGKVVVTRDVIFFEDVNYLQWKGVNKEIATGATAALDKVEKLLVEKENEGIGCDEESGGGADKPTKEPIWPEPQKKKVVEAAADVEDKGHHEGEHRETGTEEENQDVERVKRSNGTAQEGEGNPWRLIGTDATCEAAKELNELLEDGAMVIGKERGLDEIYAAPKEDVRTHLLLAATATALVSQGSLEKYSLPKEPVTVEEALAGPQREQWMAAIQEELDTLAERGTWELVPMPEGRKRRDILRELCQGVRETGSLVSSLAGSLLGNAVSGRNGEAITEWG